jgi:hypothetical protein
MMKPPDKVDFLKALGTRSPIPPDEKVQTLDEAKSQGSFEQGNKHLERPFALPFITRVTVVVVV